MDIIPADPNPFPLNHRTTPEPSITTSTISPINPRPRNDAGNEALGRAGFGEGKSIGDIFITW